MTRTTSPRLAIYIGIASMGLIAALASSKTQSCWWRRWCRCRRRLLLTNCATVTASFALSGERVLENAQSAPGLS